MEKFKFYHGQWLEIVQNSTTNSAKAVDKYIFRPEDPYIDDGHIGYITKDGDNHYKHADVNEEFEQLIGNSDVSTIITLYGIG